jgi:hypothetical protein
VEEPEKSLTIQSLFPILLDKIVNKVVNKVVIKPQTVDGKTNRRRARSIVLNVFDFIYTFSTLSSTTEMRSRLLFCVVSILVVGHIHAFSTPSTKRGHINNDVREKQRNSMENISRRNLMHGRSKPSTSSLHFFFEKPDGSEDPSESSEETIDYTTMKPAVSPQRWVQLAYLSLLALLSDWVCFSVAAAPSTFEASFSHSAASIIDIFLFTNVATSFLVTDIISNFGMQRAIKTAAVLMAAGCWCRAGAGFLPGHDGLVEYPLIIIGTVLVGIAQPFFQCTPPMLSATWFANNERSTSTAIALNFNQIGIATAFLVGGSMATSTSGLENYFGLIAVATSLITVGTLLQFENEPEIPPSSSELEKRIRGEEEPPFLESVQKFFQTQGFTKALAAFVCSISITNVVGVSSAKESIGVFV